MVIMTRKHAQLTADPPGNARRESRHSSKQRQQKPAPEESEQSEDNSESELDSEASSSSSSEPCADQPQYFTLHRHLDYPGHGENQLNQQVTGIDLFAGQTWQLDQQQLKQFPQLNDTDLVQIHHPVPIKSQHTPKKLTLDDILPPTNQPATATAQDSTNTTRLPRIAPGPFSGSTVSSLYYSAYSSFAPCYDSTGSSQSIDTTRLNYLSQRKIQDWSQRSNRYFDILNELTPLPIEKVTNKKQAQHHVPASSTSGTAGRGRRKRQKTSSSSAPTPSSSPMKESPTSTSAIEANVTETPEQLRQKINSTLIETAKLIRNLQERQFDRLRLSQQEEQDAHLDPLLSASSSILHSGRDHSFLGRTLEPGREELEEANQLLQRLSFLLARRPRPNLTEEQTDPHPEATLDLNERAEQTLVPSLESIRKSYETLAAQCLAESDSKAEISDSYYYGQLPASNPVGIFESTLVSQPDSELLAAIEQAPSNSNGGVGRVGGNPNTPSRWDPSLSTPRGASGVNFNGDLISSNHKQSLSGSISSKLRQHLQSQQHPFPSTPGVHQDQLNGFLDNRSHSPFNQKNLTQIEQQKHLQHLQVQKLISSIPTSNSNSKYNQNQNMRILPPISSPSPIPHIIPPSLSIHTSSNNTNTRLLGNSNSKNINVPSYNGLHGGTVALNHFVGFGHSDPSLMRDNNLNLDTHPNYKALASNSASLTR